MRTEEEKKFFPLLSKECSAVKLKNFKSSEQLAFT